MKKVYIYWLWLFGCIAAMVRCIEPVEVKLNNNPNQLVVDGLITDKPGPYIVALSRTAEYSLKLNGLNTAEREATVQIKDSRGQSILLTETAPGKYTTPSEFRGEIGVTYTLFITTKNKKSYQSKPELLKPVSDIDSIYAEYDNGETGKEEGFYVYLDAKDPGNSEDYYQWRWRSYKSLDFCEDIRPCCSECWDIITCLTCINVMSDALQQGRDISKRSIYRIPYTSRTRYYIMVEQYSLTKEAYQYWKQVSQQSQNVGGTFDAPASPVVGNIFNGNDKDDEVLGFFGASALKSTYRFIRRDYVSKLPNVGISPPPPNGPPPPCKPCEENATRTAIRPPGF